MSRFAAVMMKKYLPLLLAPLLLSGCNSITNLTTSQQRRNPDGLYSFAVVWETQQQSLRKDSIKPRVMIDFEAYPMELAPVLKNRWEVLIPIPADKKYVRYRYKFDYLYNSIPRPVTSSKLSPTYQLEILEK